MKLKNYITVLTVVLPLITFGQNLEVLKKINHDVWANFTKAFEEKDASLFRSIHDTELVRVAANTNEIRDINSYLLGYEDRWSVIKREQTIQFRFFERISSDNKASERGIYKFTIHPNSDKEESYYGKFHVILVKNEEVWKILVDYDSNENNTIDEENFKKAFAIDDYERY